MNKLKLSGLFQMILLFSMVPGAMALDRGLAALPIPAFPGAEGFGAASVGGRGGRVFIVDNLNDAGSGSLRECVSATGPRTCVFGVSGRIVLASPLLINDPFITIAGQTAPGNGITLSAGPSIARGIVIVRTHDVVMRYVGLRPGLNANQVLVESEYNIDSLTIGDLNQEPYNVVIDHVSMAWATDEILNTARRHHGITIQWSILSEVNDCDGDPTNNRCGGKGPLFHTGTGDQRGGGDISFHHNLLSSNQGRNPMIKNAGGVNDVVNNVIFPTTRPDGVAISTILDSTHGDINLNYVGNTLIGDPARLGDPRYIDFLGMRMAYPFVNGRIGRYQVYVRGNLGPMRPGDSCPGLSQKDCELLIINPVHVDQPQWDQRGDENLHLDAQGNMIPHPAPPVTTHDAPTAYALVLAEAGKSRRLTADGTWVAYRDSIDAKIVTDVQNNRAVQISGQPWPPSNSYWPAGTTTPSYPDVDRDGMSDTWETLHFGTLSRGSATDSSSDLDGDGYTDLEEFLNGTDPGSQTQPPAATATQPATATHTPAPGTSPTALPPTTTPTQLATATHTPAPSNTPPSLPPSATPTFIPPSLIWADGFESGDLSAWTSSTIDGGDLSVASAAALEGAWGMQAVVDDNNAIHVTDDTPNAERHYRARFAFDPNSIRMESDNAHYILHGYSGTSALAVRIEFRRSSGNYQLRAALSNDGSGWKSSAWVTLGDAPHAVAFDWRAATAAGANNGGLTLWIDGARRADLTGVDNDTRRMDRVSLGAVAGLDGGTRGRYFFDAFASER